MRDNKASKYSLKRYWRNSSYANESNLAFVKHGFEAFFKQVPSKRTQKSGNLCLKRLSFILNSNLFSWGCERESDFRASEKGQLKKAKRRHLKLHAMNVYTIQPVCGCNMANKTDMLGKPIVLEIYVNIKSIFRKTCWFSLVSNQTCNE